MLVAAALGAFGVPVLVTPLATAGPAETAALRTCPVSTIVLTVSTNGAGGSVLIYVGPRNRGGHTCLARGRASLALRDAATHTLLHVYANPYTRAVNRSLRRGPNNLFTLQWQNYCGPGRPLLIVASFGKRQAVEHDAYPGARCDLPDVPSQLRLVHPPG